MQTFCDILHYCNDKTTNRFIFTIPGRPVPYTRSIKGHQTKQSGRYFDYCEHVWSQCMYIQFQEKGKLFRIESETIYFLTKVYIYGGKLGDSDNYGKALRDALQDNKKGKRLYKDDKAIIFNADLRVQIKHKEDQRATAYIFWE